MDSSLCLFQKGEVLVTGDSSGAQVVHDDEDRNGPVAGDDDGTRDARFGVDSMVTFFSYKRETGQFKDTTEALVG